jgi:hypothetical protein
MKYAAFALAAVAAAGMASAQAKWVPLNSKEAQQAQGRAVETPRAPVPPAIAVPAPAAAIKPTENATVSPAPQAQASPAAVTDGSKPLALTCMGSGTASKATSAVGWGWGGWGVVAGHKDRGFNDQVDVRLFTGDDRIRMPRTMLPGLHGGDHGWFKVHDLVADARSIRLSAGVGMFNNPKVFIDRVTGTISISGKSGDYAGQCEVIDANAAPKF